MFFLNVKNIYTRNRMNPTVHFAVYNIDKNLRRNSDNCLVEMSAYNVAVLSRESGMQM